MKGQKINKKMGESIGVNPVAGVTLSDEKKREKISKVVKEAKNSIDKTTKKVNKAVKSL